MALKVDVSVGEFLDKMMILEIKSERIKNEDKLANVHRELEMLRDTWAASALSGEDTGDLLPRLKAVNERLWDIEDDIRRQEIGRHLRRGIHPAGPVGLRRKRRAGPDQIRAQPPAGQRPG